MPGVLARQGQTPARLRAHGAVQRCGKSWASESCRCRLAGPAVHVGRRCCGPQAALNPGLHSQPRPHTPTHPPTHSRTLQPITNPLLYGLNFIFSPRPQVQQVPCPGALRCPAGHARSWLAPRAGSKQQAGEHRFCWACTCAKQALCEASLGSAEGLRASALQAGRMRPVCPLLRPALLVVICPFPLTLVRLQAPGTWMARRRSCLKCWQLRHCCSRAAVLTAHEASFPHNNDCPS